MDCSVRESVVDLVSPASGGVYPGQEISLVGRNLNCVTQFECVFRDSVRGTELRRVPALVVSDWGLVCEVPEDLDDDVYTPANYQDVAAVHSPNGASCPIVPPLRTFRFDVVVAGESTAVAPALSAEFTLLRCQPAGAFDPVAFDFFTDATGGNPNRRGGLCGARGICSSGGYCVCPVGLCGANCEVVADDVAAVVTSAPPSGPDPLSVPQYAQTMHPTFSLYHALVQGDFFAPAGSDVEGLLAAAGNVTIGRYSVGEKWYSAVHPLYSYPVPNSNDTRSDRVDLAVGNTVNFTSGLVISGGNLVYRNEPSFVNDPLAGANAPGRVFRANPTGIFPADFAGADVAARWLSASLARLPRTGTSIYQWTTLHLTGTRPDVNVFHVSAEELDSATEIRLNLPALSTLGNSAPLSSIPVTIINVLFDRAWTEQGPGSGDWSWTGPVTVPEASAEIPIPAENILFGPNGFEGDFHNDRVASRLIWNFPYATSMRLERLGVKGSLLAPFADVNFVSGEIDGQVWVKSWTGPGQINLPLFAGASSPSLAALVDASASNTIVWVNETEVTSSGSSSSTGRRLARRGQETTTTTTGASVPAVTQTLLDLLSVAPENVVGMFGAPRQPDCGVHGELINGTCYCYDPTFRRGVECQILCTDYCNGRGMCNAENQDVCDCWNPAQWTGSRCDQSVCGSNGLLLSGGINGEPAVCGCAPGWGGEDGRCDTEVPCVYGTIQGTKCQCMTGWSGDDCTTPFPEPITCFHGRIVDEVVPVVVATGPLAGTTRDVTVYSCDCFEGWLGTTCNEWAGRGSDRCYYGVYNEDAGHCECDPFWAGERCDVFTCLHGVVTTVVLNEAGEELGTVSSPSAYDELREFEPTLESLITPDGRVLPTGSHRITVVQECRCVDGWYGSDCGTHCRSSCNWRGTVCRSDSGNTGASEVVDPGVSVPTLSATLGTMGECVCDAPFTGAQCETETIPPPAGVADAPAEDSFSSTTDVSYAPSGSDAASFARALRSMSAVAAEAAEAVSTSASSGSLRAGRALQTTATEDNVFRVTLTQVAGAWRSRSIDIVAGQSAKTADACAFASAASVVGGNAVTNGEPDELVACLPVAVDVQAILGAAEAAEFASGSPLVITVDVPESVRTRTVGTHLYATLASSESSANPDAISTACVAGSGLATAAAGYRRSTGLITSTVCEAGVYHLQIMQPSVVNRALPPPSEDEEDVPGPEVKRLSAGEIAGIVIGSVVGVAFIVAGALYGPKLLKRNLRDETLDPVGPVTPAETRRGSAGSAAAASHTTKRTSRDSPKVAPAPQGGAQRTSLVSAHGRSVEDEADEESARPASRTGEGGSIEASSANSRVVDPVALMMEGTSADDRTGGNFQ